MEDAAPRPGTERADQLPKDELEGTSTAGHSPDIGKGVPWKTFSNIKVNK